MKLTKHIGCLLALVFATASAFASTPWFTAEISKVGSETPNTGWGAAPAGWDAANGSFNDWGDGLVYTPSTSGTVASDDLQIDTSVKFTALDGTEGDPEEFTTIDISDAKAGLTLVEKGTGNFQYYGIAKVEDKMTWVALGGSIEAAPASAVPVKISLVKLDTGAYLRYEVDGTVLLPSGDQLIDAPADTVFTSMAVIGKCDGIADINGVKYSNAPGAKEEFKPTVASDDIPSAIKYNRQDLFERGIDPDDAAKVGAYLTTKTLTSNNQYGWVNVALGIDDDHMVAVESNICKQGSITLDYGFITSGATVAYEIDTSKGSSARIDTETSAIHEVKVWVKAEDNTEVLVATEQVGVMNTGKDVSELPDNVKTYDIIAVPFAGFGGTVTVATLLNTAELTDGDTLYVLRDNQYNSYQWDADNGCWKPLDGKSYTRGGSATKKATTAEEETLNPGEAVWLEHAKDSKIVIAGVGETEQDHKVTVKAGEYNLIANPTIYGFDLASAEFGTKDDMIIVEDVADPVQYAHNGSSWGKWVTRDSGKEDRRHNPIMETVFVPAGDGKDNTAKCIIPAGIGFWYKSAGTADIEINFGKNIAK